jgi:hypothetical protein
MAKRGQRQPAPRNRRAAARSTSFQSATGRTSRCSLSQSLRNVPRVGRTFVKRQDVKEGLNDRNVSGTNVQASVRSWRTASGFRVTARERWK